MNGEKINFIINSKNRDNLINPNASTIDIIVPSGLLQLQPDEMFYLNVNGFHCFKNFYNCQTGYNSTFQLIYYDISNNKTVTQYDIQQGNFDVYQLTDNLNALLINNVTVSYNVITNTFTFTRSSPVNNTQFKLYLNIINSDAFLGFPITQRNKSILLPYQTAISSTQPLNVIGDTALIIEIAGDVVIQSSLDNLNNSQFIHRKVIFFKAIDVPATGLLTYNNVDGGDSFHFKLSNQEQITWFKLNVYNQDYAVIPNMTDFILNIQFVKQKRLNLVLITLEKILDYLKDFFMLISNQIFRI